MRKIISKISVQQKDWKIKESLKCGIKKHDMENIKDPEDFSRWYSIQPMGIPKIEAGKMERREAYQAAQAGIIEYHRLGGGLNKRNVFSHCSGGPKSKIKELGVWVSHETSLPGLQTAAFLLCPHVAFLCGQIERFLVSLSLLIRTPDLSG